jgi:hypothetical protein
MGDYPAATWRCRRSQGSTSGSRRAANAVRRDRYGRKRTMANHEPGSSLCLTVSNSSSEILGGSDTEEVGGSTPPAPTTSADQRIYCSKESSVGDGSHPPHNIPHGRPHSGTRALYCLTSQVWTSRSAPRRPLVRTAPTRREPLGAHHHHLPDRPAPGRPLPCATRPGAVRASAADAFAREAHRSAMLCPRTAVWLGDRR